MMLSLVNYIHILQTEYIVLKLNYISEACLIYLNAFFYLKFNSNSPAETKESCSFVKTFAEQIFEQLSFSTIVEESTLKFQFECTFFYLFISCE